MPGFFLREGSFLINARVLPSFLAIAHRDGHVIYLPRPMNSTHFHAVPKRKRVKACRYTLTFREIVPQSRTT